MRVLDLFAGLGGWSAAFRERGDDVVTLDLDPRFGCDHVRDILTVNGLAELERSGPFHVILASPPCETFSVASIGTHWTGGWRVYAPRTEAARHGLAIASWTFSLIERYCDLHRTRYVIENPRGVLRKVIGREPTTTVWYCQYGDDRAKPTDLWTNLPGPWLACANGRTDHTSAPRGAKAGTQGRSTYAARSLVPYGLSAAIAEKMTLGASR